MRGCFSTGAVLTLLSDVGLANVLAANTRSSKASLSNAFAAILSCGSVPALLIGLCTNPRGAPHVTACVTWAFLRILWGCLLLRVLCDTSPGLFTFLRCLSVSVFQCRRARRRLGSFRTFVGSSTAARSPASAFDWRPPPTAETCQGI